MADVDLPTNQSNSQAAFAFLDEVRKRKIREEGGEVAEKIEEGAKFTFKKPTKKQLRSEKAEDEAESKDKSEPTTSEEKKSDDPKPPKKGKKSKQMTLSHLMDEEDEEDA